MPPITAVPIGFEAEALMGQLIINYYYRPLSIFDFAQVTQIKRRRKKPVCRIECRSIPRKVVQDIARTCIDI